MADADNETRLRHVEEQMQGLAEQVGNLTSLLHDFLEESTTTKIELLELARTVSRIDLRVLTNDVRSWFAIRGPGFDEEKQQEALRCVAYVDRQYESTDAYIKTSDNPNQLVTDLGEKVAKYLEKHEFNMYIDK